MITITEGIEVDDDPRSTFTSLWTWLRAVRSFGVSEEIIVEMDFIVTLHGRVVAEYDIHDGFGWSL